MNTQALTTSVLIVGAGQAAAVAAATLRQLGYADSILMVGQEAHPPYERPPLSKEALAAPAGMEPEIAVQPADFYDTQNIVTRWSTRVVSLDVQARRARLSDGADVAFEHCILATGGRARQLPGLPANPPLVHYLRTLEDAAAIRQAFAQGGSVAVLGGGFLGLEVASTARQLGLEATIVEQEPRLLARAVPEIFSNWLSNRAQAAGVRLHLGQRMESCQAGADGVALALAGGSQLTADTAVVSIGLEPETELARDAGLAIHPGNRGIEVNAQCRASQPGIYAIGDCTSQMLPGCDAAIRLESWQNANEQARIAAHAIAGQEAAPAALPWFWTDQFGCNIQMLGLLQPGLQFHVRGDMAVDEPNPQFLILGLADGRAVYALSVNAAKDLRALHSLVEQRRPVDASAFLDPAVSLRAFAKAQTA